MLTNKLSPKNVRGSNRNVSAAANKVERNQGIASGVVTVFDSSLSPSTPKRAQPKNDATDRRRTEVLYEDRYHTSKGILDDFKHVYRKQQKKKEQNNIELYEYEIGSKVLVRKKN